MRDRSAVFVGCAAAMLVVMLGLVVSAERNLVALRDAWEVPSVIVSSVDDSFGLEEALARLERFAIPAAGTPASRIEQLSSSPASERSRTSAARASLDWFDTTGGELAGQPVNVVVASHVFPFAMKPAWLAADDAALRAWVEVADGVLVHAELARRAGLHVGDVATLRTPRGTFSLHVVGTFDGAVPGTFVIAHYDQLETQVRRAAMVALPCGPEACVSLRDSVRAALRDSGVPYRADLTIDRESSDIEFSRHPMRLLRLFAPAIALALAVVLLVTRRATAWTVGGVIVGVLALVAVRAHGLVLGEWTWAHVAMPVWACVAPSVVVALLVAVPRVSMLRGALFGIVGLGVASTAMLAAGLVTAVHRAVASDARPSALVPSSVQLDQARAIVRDAGVQRAEPEIPSEIVRRIAPRTTVTVWARGVTRASSELRSDPTFVAGSAWATERMLHFLQLRDGDRVDVLGHILPVVARPGGPDLVADSTLWFDASVLGDTGSTTELVLDAAPSRPIDPLVLRTPAQRAARVQRRIETALVRAWFAVLASLLFASALVASCVASRRDRAWLAVGALGGLALPWAASPSVYCANVLLRPLFAPLPCAIASFALLLGWAVGHWSDGSALREPVVDEATLGDAALSGGEPRRARGDGE